MNVRGNDLCFLSINEASRLIRKRQLSPAELVRAHLRRIQELDGQLCAYRTLRSEAALREARVAEADILAGNHKGPLHGIPLAHKEQYDIRGLPNYVRTKDASPPPASQDAASVRRLREAGAITLGRLVMPGVDAEGRGGPPRNPWNTKHITGGSSSGSGAAVAAGLCMGSLGEDTAGSIRKPASLCGIVGLKPTFGRASRDGLAPLSWSLDDSGPMARTVEDVALLLQAIAGYDPSDPASSHAPVPDFSAGIHDGIRDLVVGVPRHFLREPDLGVDTETAASFDRALGALEALGAHVQNVDIPSLPYATIANTVIFYSETLAGREAEFQQYPKLFEDSRRVTLYLGALTTGADYVQALRLRGKLQGELAALFQTVDILALPSQPTPSPTFEEHDPFTTVYIQITQNLLSPFNLVGLPAISVPCGFSSGGLPMGLQLVGKPFDEATVLRAAYAYEQQARLFEKHPPI